MNRTLKSLLKLAALWCAFMMALPLMGAINTSDNSWSGRNVVTGGGKLVCQGSATFSGATTLSGTAKLGADGTALGTVRHYKVTVNNGATSGTVAIAGLPATAKVWATLNTSPSNAVYIKCAKPEAGAVDVVVSGDPGTTCTASVQVQY